MARAWHGLCEHRAAFAAGSAALAGRLRYYQDQEANRFNVSVGLYSPESLCISSRLCHFPLHSFSPCSLRKLLDGWTPQVIVSSENWPFAPTLCFLTFNQLHVCLGSWKISCWRTLLTADNPVKLLELFLYFYTLREFQSIPEAELLSQDPELPFPHSAHSSACSPSLLLHSPSTHHWILLWQTGLTFTSL